MNQLSGTPTQLLFEDRASEILYRYIKLYELWSEDRQALTAEMEKLAEAIGQLSKGVKAFSRLEPQVKQTLDDSVKASIHEATYQAMNAIREGSSELAGKMVNYHIDVLNQTIFKAESLLGRYELQTEWAERKRFIWTTVSNVLTAVGVGVLVVCFLMPSPLSPDQLDDMQAGREFMQAWPYLSKGERDRINQLEIDHSKKT